MVKFNPDSPAQKAFDTISRDGISDELWMIAMASTAVGVRIGENPIPNRVDEIREGMQELHDSGVLLFRGLIPLTCNERLIVQAAEIVDKALEASRDG